MARQFYYQMQWPRDSLFVSCYAHELYNYRYQLARLRLRAGYSPERQGGILQRAEHLLYGGERRHPHQPERCGTPPSPRRRIPRLWSSASPSPPSAPCWGRTSAFILTCPRPTPPPGTGRSTASCGTTPPACWPPWARRDRFRSSPPGPPLRCSSPPSAT